MATIDATLAGETSNSYVEEAEATAIAQNKPWADEWMNADPDDINVALISATSWIETLPFNGKRCTAEQRLSWPRQDAVCDGIASVCTAIPYRIKDAQVELAYQLLQNPEPITGGGGSTAPSGTYVSKQQLGDLSIEFSQFRGDVSSSCDDCDNPAIIQAFPWLSDLLGCYMGSIASGVGRVLNRVCCDEATTYPIVF